METHSVPKMLARIQLVLIVLLFAAAANGADVPRSAAKAAETALALVTRSAGVYIEQRQCFSCHHQALPIVALRLAEARGFDVDRTALHRQADFTLEHFHGRATAVADGRRVDGGPYAAGYALLALAAQRGSNTEQHNVTTAALINYLRQTQTPLGSWQIRSHRPPMEDSDFTATALAVRALTLFTVADDTDARERMDRATDWLRATEARTHEDRVFRLFGLCWATASAPDIKDASDDVRATQRTDGGWAQLDELASDAYATGQALVALRLAAAVPPDDPCYQSGVRWLIEHQRDDGSWLITTRAKPFQTYFDSGFPHEKSQFISIAGTCWASIALILAERDGDAVDGLTPLGSRFIIDASAR